MAWLVVHSILINFYMSMWKFWTLLVRIFGKMDDFINFEEHDVDDANDGFIDDCEPQTVSHNEFIVDETQSDDNKEDYYAFANVCINVKDGIQDSFLELDSKGLQLNEVSNYFNDNYDPSPEQINEFRDSPKWIKAFIRTLLFPHGLENQDSFYYAILYAFRNQLKNKKDLCQKEDRLKEDLGNLYDTLSKLKENLRLDLDIQNVLRFYKLKDKFRYLIK